MNSLKMKRQTQAQKGFTLVEIAIVLVIIGLLLGGVLKGQELIENTKIKAVKSDSDAISAAVLGYQDRFRALPGDDTAATSRGATANGDGDGLIESGEVAGVWESLRSEGFMSGSGATLPVNSFGGSTAILSTASGLRICQPGLTAAQMLLVDARFDDGNGVDTGGTTGTITGLTSAGAASAATYADAASICVTY